MTNPFKEFAALHKLDVTCNYVDARPDGFMPDDKSRPAPTHYFVTLTRKGKLVYSFYFSKGFGHAEAWAKKNKRKFSGTKGRLLAPGSWDSVMHELDRQRSFGSVLKPDSEYVRTVRAIAGPNVAPDIAEILECMQMDVSGCDVPFAEWAPDLGYSDDSIQAKKIWESCNDTRRALQSALGDAFNTFLELEA